MNKYIIDYYVIFITVSTYNVMSVFCLLSEDWTGPFISDVGLRFLFRRNLFLCVRVQDKCVCVGVSACMCVHVCEGGVHTLLVVLKSVFSNSATFSSSSLQKEQRQNKSVI